MFKDDQSESEDDDDLGTRGLSSSKKSANGGAHRNSLVTATKSMSLQEMMRNKRKRADMEKSKGLQGLKPGLLIENTLTGSSSSTTTAANLNKISAPAAVTTTPGSSQPPQPQQQAPPHPTKNKLPKNGMGLATSAASAGLGLGSGRPATSSPGPTQSAIATPIKKPSISSTSTVPSLDFDAVS